MGKELKYGSNMFTELRLSLNELRPSIEDIGKELKESSKPAADDIKALSKRGGDRVETRQDRGRGQGRRRHVRSRCRGHRGIGEVRAGSDDQVIHLQPREHWRDIFFYDINRSFVFLCNDTCMKKLVLIPFMLFAMPATGSQSVVGKWGSDGEACAFGPLHVGSKSLSSPEFSCRFDAVSRSGVTVTWTGSCDRAWGSRVPHARVTAKSSNDGMLDRLEISVNGGVSHDYVKCLR